MEPVSYSSPSVLSREKASAGQRFVALLIDVVILAIPLGALIAIAPSMKVLLQLIGVVYMATRDTLPFYNGQSFGKKAMGIKVIKEDTGAGITGDYATGVIRYIPQIIPLLNVVDALVIFRDNSKRFGDEWAKTIVVKA